MSSPGKFRNFDFNQYDFRYGIIAFLVSYGNVKRRFEKVPFIFQNISIVFEIVKFVM